MNILYGWAMNAPKLSLPDGVGFEVGQKTKNKYLVVQVYSVGTSNKQMADTFCTQVHYKNAMKPGHKDNSGVQLFFNDRQLTKRAGVMLMGSALGIPPMTTSTRLRRTNSIS